MPVRYKPEVHLVNADMSWLPEQQLSRATRYPVGIPFNTSLYAIKPANVNSGSSAWFTLTNSFNSSFEAYLTLSSGYISKVLLIRSS